MKELNAIEKKLKKINSENERKQIFCDEFFTYNSMEDYMGDTFWVKEYRKLNIVVDEYYKNDVFIVPLFLEDRSLSENIKRSSHISNTFKIHGFSNIIKKVNYKKDGKIKEEYILFVYKKGKTDNEDKTYLESEGEANIIRHNLPYYISARYFEDKAYLSNLNDKTQEYEKIKSYSPISINLIKTILKELKNVEEVNFGNKALVEKKYAPKSTLHLFKERYDNINTWIEEKDDLNKYFENPTINKNTYKSIFKSAKTNLGQFIRTAFFFSAGAFYSDINEIEKYKKFFLEKDYGIAIQTNKDKAFYAIFDIHNIGGLKEILNNLLKTEKRKYLFFTADENYGIWVRSEEKIKHAHHRNAALETLFSSCYANTKRQYRDEKFSKVKYFENKEDKKNQ